MLANSAAAIKSVAMWKSIFKAVAEWDSLEHAKIIVNVIGLHPRSDTKRVALSVRHGLKFFVGPGSGLESIFLLLRSDWSAVLFFFQFMSLRIYTYPAKCSRLMCKLHDYLALYRTYGRVRTRSILLPEAHLPFAVVFSPCRK